MSRLSTPLALAALLSLAACNGSGDASKTAVALPDVADAVGTVHDSAQPSDRFLEPDAKRRRNPQDLCELDRPVVGDLLDLRSKFAVVLGDDGVGFVTLVLAELRGLAAAPTAIDASLHTIRQQQFTIGSNLCLAATV